MSDKQGELWEQCENCQELSDFILAESCGLPTTNEQYPNGMSAVEAAIVYIIRLKKNSEDQYNIGYNDGFTEGAEDVT